MKVVLLSARTARAEVAQRARMGDASRVVRQVVSQARNEIGAQGASLTVLRDDVAQEALQARASLMEAREAVELLCANT